MAAWIASTRPCLRLVFDLHRLFERGRPLRVAVQLAQRRHAIVGQVEGRRRRPLVAEAPRQSGEAVAQVGINGEAVLRIVEGRFEDVGQAKGAEALQGERPAAEGGRHTGGQEAVAREDANAQLAEGVHGGGLADPALAGDRVDRAIGGAVDEDGYLAANPVEVRLNQVEGKAGGDRGVDGIPAAVEQALTGAGGKVVSGGNQAAAAHVDRPGGERRLAARRGVAEAGFGGHDRASSGPGDWMAPAYPARPTGATARGRGFCPVGPACPPRRPRVPLWGSRPTSGRRFTMNR